MKKFTACLIDTASPIHSPFYSSCEFSYVCYDNTKINYAVVKLLNLTSSKYRFGYMYDELTNEYRKTLGHISHVVTSVKHEGTKIFANILVLDTPEGKVLESLLNAGMEFGFFYNFKQIGFTSLDVRIINNPESCNKDYILKCCDSKENLV